MASLTPRYFLRPEAQADIEESALWYEDQRPGLGERFTGELFDLIHRIAEFPLQFPLIGGLLHAAVFFRSSLTRFTSSLTKDRS